MPLTTYIPKNMRQPCVTLNRNGIFRFNCTARDRAALNLAVRCIIHVDAEERLIVFEPLFAHQVDALGGPRESLKLVYVPELAQASVKARGLLTQEPWINAIATRSRRQDRVLPLEPYGPVERNMWAARLPKEIR